MKNAANLYFKWVAAKINGTREERKSLVEKMFKLADRSAAARRYFSAFASDELGRAYASWTRNQAVA